MSTAQLLQAEFNKLSHVIHDNVHSAFGLGTGRTFPSGEILYQEFEYGMLVQGAIEYPDRSCLVYLREPEDDHGFYFLDGPQHGDPCQSG